MGVTVIKAAIMRLGEQPGCRLDQLDAGGTLIDNAAVVHLGPRLKKWARPIKGFGQDNGTGATLWRQSRRLALGLQDPRGQRCRNSASPS